MRVGATAIRTIAEAAVSRQVLGQLTVCTRGVGFTDVTGAVAGYLAASGLDTGVALLFCRHTSASLTIQENADPDVLTDLTAALDRLAPRDAAYVHGTEGPDDMPAHIRTMVTDVSLAIPFRGGRMMLGRWQGIYLVEHRDRPHEREVLVQLLGG